MRTSIQLNSQIVKDAVELSLKESEQEMMIDLYMLTLSEKEYLKTIK